MSTQKLGTWALLAVVVAWTGCASTPTIPTVPEAPNLTDILQAAGNAENSVVNVTPQAPCCKRQTLPGFLGVYDACGAVTGCINNIRNRLGMLFPGLEATPPVLAITDPANLESETPAVAAAAEIKAQEDQAAQKIKALRYLATIGCGGCYEGVEEAFIAAMDDCTEEVRFEAVKAIRETTGKNCCFCAQGACCSKAVQEKLLDLAYGKTDTCCDKEPSARVRRQARLALNACGPAIEAAEPELENGEPEGPTEGPAEGPVEVPTPPAEGDADGTTPPAEDEADSSVSRPNNGGPRAVGSSPASAPSPVRLAPPNRTLSWNGSSHSQPTLLPPVGP